MLEASLRDKFTASTYSLHRQNMPTECGMYEEATGGGWGGG